MLSAWGVDECEGRFLMFCHHLGWLSTLKLQKVSEGEVGVREVLVMVCHHLSAFQFLKKDQIQFFLILLDGDFPDDDDDNDSDGGYDDDDGCGWWSKSEKILPGHA